jgi:mRNA interferase RelE/StbE
MNEPYAIRFTKVAQKSFIILNKSDKLLIIDKIKQLANNPFEMTNVKKLVANDISYRLRVGNYRVLFDRDDVIRIIDIIDIIRRKDAYRRF